MISQLRSLREFYMGTLFDFFFDNEALIAKGQHGFVRRKACVTNLYEKLDLINKSLFECFSVDVVYFGFLKALFHGVVILLRRKCVLGSLPDVRSRES